VRRVICCLIIVGAIIGASGCGVIPAYTRANQELKAGTPCPPTRASMVGIDDEVFVGIALSGGGSRAANFSAAVLLELQDLGFLQTASAISSVSGGSVTAAYYGLFGNQDSQWNPKRVREALVSDFQTNWVLRWFAPHHVVRYWLTDFDRSDIMKRVFDDYLFKGRPFKAMGAGRPRIFINATSRVTVDGYVFTDQGFQELGSCLADYPVSHAVMASAAFPGAFQNVTLEDYRRERKGKGRYFDHLYDGGPTDNLGVETLRRTVQRLLKTSSAAKPKRCFFFIVDAYTTPGRPDLATERDTRTVIDYIVDTNAIAATDALLANRRSDVLGEIGFEDTEIGLRPFQTFSVPADDETDGEPSIPCAAWHLTFQRLILAGQPEARLSPEPKTLQEMHDVGRAVNRIRTRFNLRGPGDYSEQALQDLLFRAAFLVVNRDTESLNAACDWFAGNGLRACEKLK